jgi:hypothetical protein
VGGQQSATNPAASRVDTTIPISRFRSEYDFLCRERLFSLEDGEMRDDWHEEGLQQMQPFTHLFEKLV